MINLRRLAAFSLTWSFVLATIATIAVLAMTAD